MSNGLDTWHVSGLKGTGSADIVVKDRFVAEDCAADLFGPPTHCGIASNVAGRRRSYVAAWRSHRARWRSTILVAPPCGQAALGATTPWPTNCVPEPAR